MLRDNLFGARVAFGFAPFAEYNLRHEIEYAINTKQKNSTETNAYGENFVYGTSMQTQALLFNTYYDFNNSTKFTPYVGFGLGVSHLKAIVENTSKDDVDFSESRSGSDYNFAYALAAGVEYKLSEKLACDLQVRYFDYGKATESVQTRDDRYGLEFDAKSSGKVNGFDVALGLKYMF